MCCLLRVCLCVCVCVFFLFGPVFVQTLTCQPSLSAPEDNLWHLEIVQRGVHALQSNASHR